MTSDSEKPLAGRIALVTGATRGIGEAIALGLAQAGAHVIAVGRTQGALEALDDAIFAATGEHATLVPWTCARPTGWISWARPSTSVTASWTSWSAPLGCWAP
jgi:NAD(P)-dependent dehydrogenase (short-subunit alcohol dehydrogenase family)